MQLEVELVPKLAAIPAAQWDALVGDDDPFIEHAFLQALEESGCVGGRSGWLPLHVVAREAGKLVGALPCYVKSHSYGEYIFDFRWAAAAERAGLSYYPKLVCMVPFTPATGKRILIAEASDGALIVSALARGVEAARARLDASSVHFLFLSEAERELLVRNAPLIARESLQFHWHSEGDESFDAYLGRFRSALRKQVRRERAEVLRAGVDVSVRRGDELDAREWRALFEFYTDTCHKRGSGPYLNRRFFELLRERFAHRVLAVLAYRGREAIAGTLNFQKGKHLYGRYWGCREDVPSLHFECCYYRLIEYAISQRFTRFEAGAQGTHKLRRGLLPALVHSAHGIAHEGLRRAVEGDLGRERDAIRLEMAALAEHGPFKRG